MTTREYMAQRLREFRIAKKLTVEEVGAHIGKSGKTISAWEVGRGQPDADKLVELCQLYKVRISDFYDESANDDPALAQDEKMALECFQRLNHEGRRIALSVLKALVKSGDYPTE